jgi:hypothetical protein
MIPAPNDHELDQIIAAVAKQRDGRSDISTDEWLSALVLLRDTRAQLFALRAQQADPLAALATLADLHDAHKLVDLWRAAATRAENGCLEARRERDALSDEVDNLRTLLANAEQRVEATEVQTIMQVVSYLENLVEAHRLRAVDCGRRNDFRSAKEADVQFVALREAAVAIARGDWRSNP